MNSHGFYLCWLDLLNLILLWLFWLSYSLYNWIHKNPYVDHYFDYNLICMDLKKNYESMSDVFMNLCMIYKRQWFMI